MNKSLRRGGGGGGGAGSSTVTSDPSPDASVASTLSPTGPSRTEPPSCPRVQPHRLEGAGLSAPSSVWVRGGDAQEQEQQDQQQWTPAAPEMYKIISQNHWRDVKTPTLETRWHHAATIIVLLRRCSEEVTEEEENRGDEIQQEVKFPSGDKKQPFTDSSTRNTDELQELHPPIYREEEERLRQRRGGEKKEKKYIQFL